MFERHGAVASEASFANAGVVAPGYVTPWAAPGMPWKMARMLFSRHAPIKLALPLSAHELKWILSWWQACRLDTYLINRGRLQRLAFYSRERLIALTDSLQLEYDRSAGYMVMLRSEKDRRLAQPGLQVLRDAGVVFKEIAADQVRTIEPALNPDAEFLCAIHLPNDGVGNCRQFALLLKTAAQKRGVDFHFHSAVAPLDAACPASLQVRSGAGTQQHDFHAVVVCGGVAAVDLLRPLGLRLPLAAVYGYSISAPIAEPLNAPRSALMDERYKVAISRLGNRVRVAGSAEIGGALQRKRPAAVQTLYKVLHDWFPAAAQLASPGISVQEWKGARPMLPDGPPLIGATGIPGVWINIGHGSSGWALSCGSARAVADLMSGRQPELDIEGLGIERLFA